MLKFLLTIFLLASGTKLVAGNELFKLKLTFESICLQEEEDGQEKAEKKQTKHAEDDFSVYYHVHYRIILVGGNQVIPLRHHKIYYSFFDQPNTPPPDLA